MADDIDVEGFLDSYERKVVTVPVCARGDLVAQHAALEAQILRHGPSDTLHDADLAALRNDLRALEAEMDAATKEFTFQAVPTQRWQDLIRKNPPTEEQARAHGPMLDHNPDTFPIAAVAACAVRPELTVEQAKRMHELLPDGEWQRIWATVREANVGVVTTPKSVAAGLIDAALASVASSTTAPPEESPAASS